MRNNISEPLFVEEIASYLNVSTRQLERVFQQYFHYSPSQYYLRPATDRGAQSPAPYRHHRTRDSD